MQKRWTILKADLEKVSLLRESLKIHPAICKILVQRNIETFDEAKNFYRPNLTDLHDPWLMKDMEKAVNRIISAIEKQEKILIYGDYDVDGTTSVACMFQFLCNIHSKLDFYILLCLREGYGDSNVGFDFGNNNSFSIIIFCDCGI